MPAPRRTPQNATSLQNISGTDDDIIINPQQQLPSLPICKSQPHSTTLLQHIHQPTDQPTTPQKNKTMGLLSSLNPFASPSPTAAAAEEVRSGVRAPDRTERRRCWDARDAYFSCLDASKILDPLSKEGAQACLPQNAVFERDCAREWVAYFKKWRVADHNKKQRIKALEAQGAHAVEITGGPGGPPAQ